MTDLQTGLYLALCIALVPAMDFAHSASVGRGAFAREGLLLSWEARQLEGQAGAKALPDGSGQGNDAALVGAAKFASGPARFELDPAAALVATKPIRPEHITVEAAFRVDRKGGPLQLIVTTFPPKVRRVAPARGNTRQWVLQIRGEPPMGHYFQGFLDFGIFGEDSRWHMATSDARPSRGWHHAIGTFDGREVRLLLDGRLQTRQRPGLNGEYEGRLNRPVDGVVNLPAVGSNTQSGSNGFEGAVALARIYSRALADEEIAQNHAYAKTLVPQLAETQPAGARPVKPRFKVLFSNDFTNLHIVSPYHKKGGPFSPEQLRASVRETAGVDVHMLQPTTGWVPWWPSKLYPMAEHHRWWAEHYGIDPKRIRVPGVHRNILDGWDPFKDFIDECHKVGQAPFISYRLNDLHHLTHADTPKNTQGMHAISRFYAEHPEYRLGRCGTGHDWAIPEARAHKLAFIREICEGYDLAGFELDFMRHPRFFNDDTPLPERVKIMNEFVANVRAALDRGAKPGQHRWLCARVPCKLDMLPAIGIDLVEIVDAGVDMVNLSASFFTFQDHDVASVRAMLPDAAVFLEMCHCTMTGAVVGKADGDNFLFLRTTDQQYYTTAHMAYRRGADGMSLFNFVYYREHGTAGRGPFNEPPLHVLKRLGDPEWLAKQPQWYVWSSNWFSQMQGRFDKGDAYVYKLDMAPTEHQRNDGVFRLMTKEDCSKRRWMVKVDGTTLEPIAYVHKPIDHPYESGMGDPSNYACFKCPRALVRDGVNKVVLILEDGARTTVQYMDLVLP